MKKKRINPLFIWIQKHLLIQKRKAHNIYLSQIGFINLFPNQYFLIKSVSIFRLCFEFFFLGFIIPFQDMIGIKQKLIQLQNQFLHSGYLDFILDLFLIIEIFPAVLGIVYILGNQGERLLFTINQNIHSTIFHYCKNIYKTSFAFATHIVCLFNYATVFSILFFIITFSVHNYTNEFILKARELITLSLANTLIVFHILKENDTQKKKLAKCKIIFFDPLLDVAVWSVFVLFICICLFFPNNLFSNLLEIGLLFVLSISILFSSQPIFTQMQKSFRVGLHISSLLILIYQFFIPIQNLLILTLIFFTSLFLLGYLHFFWSKKIINNLSVNRIKRINSKKEELLPLSIYNKNYLWVAGLLYLGANSNSKNRMGDSFFHLAAKNEDIHSITALIKFKGDVNLKNNFQLSPLHIAASQINFKILVSLINAGADVKAKDSQGRTPLHRLCSHSPMKIKNHKEHINCVKLLLDSGADPMEKDKAENTAYENAIKWDANYLVLIMKPYIKKEINYASE